MKLVARFWDWIDSRAIVRRVSLAFTFYLTYAAFEWAKHFADATHLDGVSAAAILAAVTGPITALQAFVFRLYVGSRTEDTPTTTGG